jgi:hypothetical protein
MAQKPAPRRLRDLVARPGKRQSTATILENQSSDAVQRPANTGTRDPRDINLPDEQAGTPVGKLRRDERSKDPLKQGYREDLRKKRTASPQADDQADIIFGGDPDDPRWDDYLAPPPTKDVNLPYEGSVQDQDAQAATRRRRKQTRIPQRLRDLAGTA